MDCHVFQSMVNASTPTAWGSGIGDTKRGSCVFDLVVKRSICNPGTLEDIIRNEALSRAHSDDTGVFRESTSAMTFLTPAR